MYLRIGEAEARFDLPAALAHAVYFGLFEVQPGAGCGIADDGGDGEDALPSHA